MLNFGKLVKSVLEHYYTPVLVLLHFSAKISTSLTSLTMSRLNSRTELMSDKNVDEEGIEFFFASDARWVDCALSIPLLPSVAVPP